MEQAFLRLFLRWMGRERERERERERGASEEVCADSAVQPLYRAHAHENVSIQTCPRA